MASQIPTDVLFDVLQLLPAKDLCLARTVSRSWRTITSGEAFLRAHAERHKEPLLLAKFRGDGTNVYLVDLSGNVVKRIPGADGGLRVQRTRLDLACLATERNTCRVLNPATGGIHQVLPADNPVILRKFFTLYALGWVASTGEYKLLHQWTHRLFNSSRVHVLTVNRDGGTDNAQWRPSSCARISIDVCSGVAVDGVVYYLTSVLYDANNGGIPAGYNFPLDPHGKVVFDNMALYHASNARIPAADYILSFDLASEEWRRDLRGPSSTGNITSGPMQRRQLTLADLRGSLVLAHHPPSLSIMDLWFLLDFDSSLWLKQYSIRTESVTTSLEAGYRLIPLLALDDSRLVIHLAPTGLLFICDPGSNTFTRVDTRHRLDSVGVYTGSLLGSQQGDMV